MPPTAFAIKQEPERRAADQVEVASAARESGRTLAETAWMLVAAIIALVVIGIIFRSPAIAAACALAATGIGTIWTVRAVHDARSRR